MLAHGLPAVRWVAREGILGAGGLGAVEFFQSLGLALDRVWLDLALGRRCHRLGYGFGVVDRLLQGIYLYNRSS